jgi:hypothetical protein
LAAGSDPQAAVSTASRTFYNTTNVSKKPSTAAALPVSPADVNFIPKSIKSPLPTTPRLVYRSQTSSAVTTGETRDHERHHQQQQHKPLHGTPTTDQSGSDDVDQNTTQ